MIRLLLPLAEKPVDIIFQYLSDHHEENWELLLKYFLVDVFLIKFFKGEDESHSDNEEINEFKQQIDLTDDEKVVLLKFIFGYVKYLYSKSMMMRYRPNW